MAFRLSCLCVLLCLAFVTGCAVKEPKRLVSPRFPHQPAQTLAKAPEHSVPAHQLTRVAAARGGWGYERSNAFVLSPLHKGKKGIRMNTIPLENAWVRTRNHVEFSETPPQGQRYLVVNQGKMSRTVGTWEGRMYAVWRGVLYVFYEQDNPKVYADMVNVPLAQRATGATMARARQVSREYWFDVTETFGATPQAVAHKAPASQAKNAGVKREVKKI